MNKSLSPATLRLGHITAYVSGLCLHINMGLRGESALAVFVNTHCLAVQQSFQCKFLTPVALRVLACKSWLHGTGSYMLLEALAFLRF